MSNDDDQIAPGGVEEIRRRLLGHYDSGKRDLPWRGETDPYRIWVSEVMLQQTRVDSVIPYYRRWVARFPTLESLAAAGEEEVLRSWQGLGYYSRARSLLSAARLVRERCRGSLPSSAAELSELPGIGEYTAGAVASIAFGEAVPAVDGNARRVLSRLFDLPDPRPGTLQRLAGELLDPARPGDFNQALMELGAVECAPRAPACGECPLRDVCLARARGTAHERPLRRGRKSVPEVGIGVLVAVSASVSPQGSRFLLRKRPKKGLLAGMWEFPGVELGEARKGSRDGAAPLSHGARVTPAEEENMALAAVRSMAREMEIQAVERPVALPPIVHVFSHLKAIYRPFLFQVSEPGSVESGSWVAQDQLENLPLPVAQQKIAAAGRRAVRPEL